MGLDPAVVRRYLHDTAAGTTTDAQGKAYEALAVYLFECIPGCLAERDIISFFGAEQIDVGVGNPRLAEGLALLPTALIVECKDWARPADSKTVGYFINILANRSVEAGILIAANGITGDPDELSRAHALGISAVARGIKILIMTTAEIENLTGRAREPLLGNVQHALRRARRARCRNGGPAPSRRTRGWWVGSAAVKDCGGHPVHGDLRRVCSATVSGSRPQGRGGF